MVAAVPSDQSLCPTSLSPQEDTLVHFELRVGTMPWSKLIGATRSAWGVQGGRGAKGAEVDGGGMDGLTETGPVPRSPAYEVFVDTGVLDIAWAASSADQGGQGEDGRSVYHVRIPLPPLKVRRKCVTVQQLLPVVASLGQACRVQYLIENTSAVSRTLKIVAHAITDVTLDGVTDQDLTLLPSQVEVVEWLITPLKLGKCRCPAIQVLNVVRGTLEEAQVLLDTAQRTAVLDVTA